MKKSLITALAFILLVLLAKNSYCHDADIPKTLSLQKLNEKAPDFVIHGKDGKSISLKNNPGKVIILHFWATWCKPCKVEFPVFEKMYMDFKDKDVVFLPISIDSRVTQEELDSYSHKLGVTFPVFLAAGGVTDRYWTWGVPVTYLINRKGYLVARALGPRDWSSDEFKAFVDSLLMDK